MAGRPGKYETHVKPRLEEVRLWRLEGKTDKEIATLLQISLSSFCLYQTRFSEFSEALSVTPGGAVADMYQSLFDRARGFTARTRSIKKHKDSRGNVIDTWETVEEKQVPGDTRAAEIWLRRFDPEYVKREHPERFAGAGGADVEDLTPLAEMLNADD